VIWNFLKLSVEGFVTGMAFFALVSIVAYLNHAAPPPPQRIAVVSMVRNEAAILPRMIDSVRRTLPDAMFFFCDTGSTDGTLDIIKSHQVVNYTWENFEVSRNRCKDLALQLLPAEYEYILFMDADQEVEYATSTAESIKYDANTIQIRSSDPELTHNSLLLLMRRNVTAQCRYRLWTHEFLDCPSHLSYGYYNGLQLVHHRDGSSYDVKHVRDVTLLTAWIREVGTPDLLPRALFHLAQAYHAQYDAENAIATYKRHLEVENYLNYRYQSRLHIAKLLLWMNRPYAEVRDAFLESLFEHDGLWRFESYYHLARLARQVGRVNECLLYSNAALKAPPLDHSRAPLFIEPTVYYWKLEMERAHCLFLYGLKQEAKSIYMELLARPMMKNEEVRTWIENELKKI